MDYLSSHVYIYQTKAETANKHIRLYKMGIYGRYGKSERAMANAFIRIRQCSLGRR